MKSTILVLILFISVTLAVHPLASLRKLSAQDLLQDDLVEIIETTQTQQSSNLSRQYYVLSAVGREKRQAYSSMNRLLNRVIGILLRNKIIPDRDSLAQSKTKPKFLSNQRRWSFQTIFAFYGSGKELQKVNGQLTRLGVKPLQTKPSISFLNEKLQVLSVFNSAKNRVHTELDHLPDWGIVEVVDIQIQGKELKNSDQLQQELEEEFNDEMDSGEEDVDKVGDTQEHMWMKVVFRLGQFDQDDTQTYDDEDDIDQNTQESVESIETQDM